MKHHYPLIIILLLASHLTFSQSGPPPPPPIITADGRMPNNYRPVSESEGLYIYSFLGKRGLYSKLDKKFRTLNVYGWLSRVETRLDGKKLFVATRDRKYGVIDEYGESIIPHEFDEVVVLYKDKGFLGLSTGNEPVVFTFAGNKLYGCDRKDLFIAGGGNLSLASTHPNYAVFSVFDNDKCDWLHWQGNGSAIKNEGVTLVRVLKTSEHGKTSIVFNGKGVAVWSDKNLSITSFITDDLWAVRTPKNKKGIISPDGEMIIPPVYDHFYWPGKEFIWAFNDFMGYDLFTVSGYKVAVSSLRPGKLGDLKSYSVVYNDNGLAGVVNSLGELVVPQKYSKIYRSSACGHKGPKLVFAELYGRTEVYSDDFKLLTTQMYDDFNYTREGANECSVIAGIGGMLEILDVGFVQISTQKFKSFFHDSQNLNELVGQNISESQFNAQTQGWMIDATGDKFVLMKSGEIITVEEFITKNK